MSHTINIGIGRKEIMIMSTMELDAQRMEQDLLPFTIEELNARIDEAEAEIDNNILGFTVEEVHNMMINKYPWLYNKEENGIKPTK